VVIRVRDRPLPGGMRRHFAADDPFAPSSDRPGERGGHPRTVAHVAVAVPVPRGARTVRAYPVSRPGRGRCDRHRNAPAPGPGSVGGQADALRWSRSAASPGITRHTGQAARSSGSGSPGRAGRPGSPRTPPPYPVPFPPTSSAAA